MENVKISRMEEKDLKAVIEIQRELFTSDLLEDISILRRKCELFPEGCWVVKIEDKVVGYLVSHPWLLSCPPMLGTYIESLPEAPDCLYLHDIGVLTRIAGKGVGHKIIMKIKQFARQKGYTAISGVSVMRTRGYWKRHGLIETPLNPEKDQALIEHYGPEACYMTTTL